MTARRREILRVAAELFTRFGYRKTSIEDLTRAAGVSKGALYLEFAGKEELFEALVRHEFRLYLATAQDRIAADPEGGRLSRIYQHCAEALLERAFLRALYTADENVLAATMNRRGPDRYRPRVLLGADFLAHMQHAGLIDATIDPHVLSHTLSVLTVGPLLAEPVLHDETSPTLSQTLAMVQTMIVTTYETPGGDVAEGKRAFSELVRDIDEALTDPPAEAADSDS